MDKKDKFFLALLAITLFVGTILGFAIKDKKVITKVETVVQTETVVREVQPPPLPVECVTGSVAYYAKEFDVFMSFGEVQICGSDLHFTPIVGPNYEEYIASLENKIKRLQDCVLDNNRNCADVAKQ